MSHENRSIFHILIELWIFTEPQYGFTLSNKNAERAGFYDLAMNNSCVMRLTSQLIQFVLWKKSLIAIFHQKIASLRIFNRKFRPNFSGNDCIFGSKQQKQQKIQYLQRNYIRNWVYEFLTMNYNQPQPSNVQIYFSTLFFLCTLRSKLNFHPRPAFLEPP